MDLKLSDIITIVIAIAIPVIGFTVLIIPGAMSSVVTFVMQEDRCPYIFYGGAAVVFAISRLPHLPAHPAATAQAGTND